MSTIHKNIVDQYTTTHDFFISLSDFIDERRWCRTGEKVALIPMDSQELPIGNLDLSRRKLDN